MSIKPFYAFNENIKVAYIDDHNKDVWAMNEGEPSSVGIDGSEHYKPDLRKSISIRNKFIILDNRVRHFKKLFPTYKIGIGSKHIYYSGDFMGKHCDTRLPDLDGLPHIMTCILIRGDFDGGTLYIDDHKIKDSSLKNVPCYSKRSSDKYHDQYLNVVFPINVYHEVKPVIRGERHAFVFPVYGVFDPYACTVQTLQNAPKCTTKYHELLEELDKLIKNPTDYDSDKRSRVMAYVKAMENPYLCSKYAYYQDDCGDTVYHDLYDDSYESRKNHVSYFSYILDGQTVVMETKEEVVIPANATNIVINPKGIAGPAILKDIKDTVEMYLEKFNEELLDDREEAKKEEAKKEKLKKIELPSGMFIYITKHMYYADVTIDTLVGVDSYIARQCQADGRRVSLSITRLSLDNVEDSDVAIYKYIEEFNWLSMVRHSCDMPKTELIKELNCEFDDQGGYEPYSHKLHCVLCIEEAH